MVKSSRDFTTLKNTRSMYSTPVAESMLYPELGGKTLTSATEGGKALLFLAFSQETPRLMIQADNNTGTPLKPDEYVQVVRSIDADNWCITGKISESAFQTLSDHAV